MVGIIEVISKYREIAKALKVAKNHIKINKPNLIILVDYGTVNLKIAKYAKKLGYSSIYFTLRLNCGHGREK